MSSVVALNYDYINFVLGFLRDLLGTDLPLALLCSSASFADPRVFSVARKR